MDNRPEAVRAPAHWPNSASAVPVRPRRPVACPPSGGDAHDGPERPGSVGGLRPRRPQQAQRPLAFHACGAGRRSLAAQVGRRAGGPARTGGPRGRRWQLGRTGRDDVPPWRAARHAGRSARSGKRVRRPGDALEVAPSGSVVRDRDGMPTRRLAPGGVSSSRPDAGAVPGAPSRPDRQATRWGTFQAEGAVARPRRHGSGECRMRAAGKRLADASRRSRRTVSTSARWPCVRPPARASRRGGGGHRTAVGRPRSQSAGRGLARAGPRDVGASGVPARRSDRGQTAVRRTAAMRPASSNSISAALPPGRSVRIRFPSSRDGRPW